MKYKLKTFLKPFSKLLMVTCLSIALIGIIYFVLKKTGLIGKFSNVKELKELIISTGFWSYFVYTLLQFLQVTILPLPSMATTIVGYLIFGPLKTFILSTMAIILGSIFAYILGRVFGTKLLFWIAGREKATILQKRMENGKYAFFLMMLFPLFPDDILCILAGVVNMNFKYFLFTNLITRPIGIFCICFIGSGKLIPFRSWGLIIWAIVAVIIITLFILSIKYKKQIESFLDFKK